MNNVILLSEIHPYASKIHNPLNQVDDWYNLFSQRDREYLNRYAKINFVDGIKYIYEKAEKAGKELVIRDWSHLDYFGKPFVEPKYRLELAGRLKSTFVLKRIFWLRHPLDVWLSLQRLAIMRNADFNENLFLEGFYQFTQKAKAGRHLYKYEDFVENPKQALQQICKALDVNYDSDWVSKWHSNNRVTGAKIRDPDISPRDNQRPKKIEQQFNELPLYRKINAMLNY